MLVFSADPARIDRDRVHRWLSEESYWARGRSREKQEAAIDGSRNYGVYEAAGPTGGGDVQLGYARIVTDEATFAWLCDVFVDASARGRGVGKTLIAGIVADLEPLGLTRLALATADAHGLYARYGFAPLADPSMWMSRVATAV